MSKSVNTQTQQEVLLMHKLQRNQELKDKIQPFASNNYIDSSGISSSNPYLSNQSSQRIAADSNSHQRKQIGKAFDNNYTSEYASNHTIITTNTNKQKTSRKYLQSELNQSLDFSQTGGNTQTCLQPKGISSTSPLRTHSSNQSQQIILNQNEKASNKDNEQENNVPSMAKKRFKNTNAQQDEDQYYNAKIFPNKTDSVSSVPSSLKDKRLSLAKAHQIPESNRSNLRKDSAKQANKKNIPGFKFEVEVKKQISFSGDNIREAKKNRKGKKRKSKLMKSVGVMSDDDQLNQKKAQDDIQNVKVIGSSDQSQLDQAKNRNFKNKKRKCQEEKNSRALKIKQYRIQTPTDNMILNQSIGGVGHFRSILSPNIRHQKFHSIDIFRPSTSSPKSMTGGGGNMRIYKGIAIASNSPSAQNIQNFHSFNQNLNSIMPPVTPPGLRRMLSQSLIEQGSPQNKQDTKNSDLLPQKIMQETGSFGHKDSANIFGSDSEYKSIEQHQMSLRESKDFAILNKNQLQKSPRRNAKFNESVSSQIRMKMHSSQQIKTDDNANKLSNLISSASRSPRNDNVGACKFSNTNSPSIKKRVISKYYEGGKKKKLIQQPQTYPIINSIQFTGNSSPHPPTPALEHNNMTPTAAQDGRNLTKLDLSPALISGGASIGNTRHIPAGGIASLYRSQFSDGTSHLSSIVDPQTNLGINSEQVASIQTVNSPNNKINMLVSQTPKKIKTPQPQIASASEQKLAELIPTQSSPQASPMLNQRVLPDSKFHSFGLLQSKNNIEDSNILGLRLIENLGNEQEDEEDRASKKLWRPQELISPNFSYSKDNKLNNGLPTATFDSINNKSLSSGKNLRSQKQNSEMKVKLMRFNDNSKDFQQTVNTQEVELIKKGKSKKNMIQMNKKMVKSTYLQKRIPLSLSNFQFQPLENLDYEDIEQLIDQQQQPAFAQLPHTTHHSKISSFTFNYMNYKNQNPSSKAQSRGQNAAQKRNSQIPRKIKRPFIGSKNLAAPVAPQDLSPYSSKHGRITKRSAGAWCQFPQSMLTEEDRMRLNAASGNINGKVIWGFYSAGAEDWSNVLKKMQQASRPASAALRAQSCKKFQIRAHYYSHLEANNEVSERLSAQAIKQMSKQSSRKGSRPMSTPQQRQKTIAIKMKTVSYDNSDSATTSKQFGVVPITSNAAKKAHPYIINNMRASFSQDLLKSRAHNNSFTDANLISQKTLHPYIQQYDQQNQQHSNQIPKGLIFKEKQLSRSATPSLSKLKNSGSQTPGRVKKMKKNMKSRARSTTFISPLYTQPVVVVEEEPLKQADITSRHHQRLGSIA